MLHKLLISILVLSALFSCQTKTKFTKAQLGSNQESQMSRCDNVSELIQSHENGFMKFRTKKKNVKIGDIWNVNFNLIGEKCKVVRWKKSRFSYMCNMTSPDKTVALGRYKNAKQKIEACLGESWSIHEKEGKLKGGKIAIYTNKQNNTTVATHVLAVEGLFKEQWTNYIFVGDSERLKSNEFD